MKVQTIYIFSTSTQWWEITCAPLYPVKLTAPFYPSRRYVLGRFPKFTIGLNRLQIAFQNSFLNRLKPIVNFGTNRLFILGRVNKKEQLLLLLFFEAIARVLFNKKACLGWAKAFTHEQLLCHGSICSHVE
jgi:hypothetical protein